MFFTFFLNNSNLNMFFSKKCHNSVKRLIIEFKHVRFKSSVSSMSCNTNAKEALTIRIHKLSENLGCTALTARKIVSKNNQILALPSADFLRNTKFCREYFKLSDIVEIPFILSMNTSLLQHRYFSLIELGCTNVTAIHIMRFLHIMKKSPEELTTENLACNFKQSLEDCLKFFDPEYRDEKKLHLNRLYTNASCLQNIKEAMNAEFLSTKLNISLSKAYQLFKSYPPIRLQSIVNTNHVLDLLCGRFGFSISKIFQAPSLLSLHHENVELFLAEVPNILGVRTSYVVYKLPLLLRRPVESVLEVERILKKFNISEQQFINCPKVVILTPTTLQQRLEVLCKSEDFSVLKSYKKFLWLVFYYKNVKSRLASLKEFDIPTGISMFTLSKPKFEKYLCFRESRCHINDVCFYLADALKCDESNIEMKLREYPNFSCSSLQNCRQVVEFLFDSGVSKQQLYNGVGIIFYDADVVKMFFDNLKRHPSVQPYSEWVNHYNLIQLLIYSIEVETGFMASRLCSARARIEDEPLISANYSL
ncbi:uncharacterized protein LOC129229894 [Uloborus diversus]|uniref:uncharacterized protein LOC129229894 n=1 Tax=Uloborus diversus TaxID=327109 RepID=UPI0024091A51|nr:uncharacterized protein LOC129229894 [Uloborus diversus]